MLRYLYDNVRYVNLFLFIYFSFERQSVASADRRKNDDGRGRRPDIMFITIDNDEDKTYELMYSECSRVVCTPQKKEEDRVKLWREVNDGMYWAHKSRRLTKEQFSIIGIQVTGTTLCLNVLTRDHVDVHRYYKLRETNIPIRYSNLPNLVEFIHTLLIFRNILIVNMSILHNCQSRRSSRNTNSSTIPSD